MREQLIRYADLLFAGAADTDDIKQEIPPNTLDRYDDLVSQGKMPKAAYSLAIAGIGDISEILNPPAQDVPPNAFSQRAYRSCLEKCFAPYCHCPVRHFHHPLVVSAPLWYDYLRSGRNHIYRLHSRDPAHTCPGRWR